MNDNNVYVCGWKLLPACLLFWIWVRGADWINRDAYDHRLPYLRWNSIVLSSFAVGFLLWLLSPWLALGLPLLATACLGPLVVYILDRNERVEEHQQVFTAAHLRFWLAERLAPWGIRIAAEAAHPLDTGPLQLAAGGGPDEQHEAQRLLAARQCPGFNPARELLLAAFQQRATALVIDCGVKLAACTHVIDGQWLPQPALPLEEVEPILTALAVLAGVNPNEHIEQQEGQFLVRYESATFTAALNSKGTASGCRVLLELAASPTGFADLDALGMRPKMREQVQALLAPGQGLFLFAAPPDAGLRTLTDVGLRSMDRFVREIVAIEERDRRYTEVENVPVVTYDANAGESAATVLPRVLRSEPQALVVRDLLDSATLHALCEEALRIQVIGTVRARDAAEALRRVATVHGRAPEFARALGGVLCQRLIRKLCPACKSPQAVTPDIEERWGLPAQRVPQVFQPPPNTDAKGRPLKACQACGGGGYHGRTGIFELLVVNDAVRELIATAPHTDTLRERLAQAGMYTFRQEGLLLVAKGVTSLEELQRVLE